MLAAAAALVYRICLALIALLLALILALPLLRGPAVDAGRYYDLLIVIGPPTLFPAVFYLASYWFYRSEYVRAGRRSLIFEFFALVPFVITAFMVSRLAG